MYRNYRITTLADKATDPKRQKELEGISQSLERVPFYGARSFFEAIQAVHFIMVLMHIEGTGPYVMGRIDQYLYPFYKADLDRGLLTPQEAQELIELLFIKLTAIIRLWSNQGTMVSPGYKPTQTITLGGVDSGEKDASNELTYLFLNAAEAVRAIQPDIALLCHPRETPYALMLRAAEMNALGLGIPKFFNTEVIKTMLVDAGYTVEEATVGWIRGCTGIAGPGCKQQGYSSGAYLNPAMALETVLFNGRKRTPGKPGSGQLLGVATGDPRQFASFDDLMKALKIQLAAQIKDGHVASCLVQQVRAEDFPLPLESLFTDACIERGLTPAAGEAKINVGPGIGITGGIATVADSLAAIKKLVFEEKKLTMGELLNAVDANFEGYEPVRQMLLNQSPKFGNDDDYVDDSAREIWQSASSEAKKHVTHLGNTNKCGTYSPMSNSFEGKKTWATPDGRKAGTPLSNHYGPTDGLDISGPAANINSVTKLGIDRQAGAIHNLYLVNVNSEDDFHRIVDLVELFFHRGGSHLQLNCQDKEVFVDAQKHPERYPGLMVRVAGYVAFFVELPKEIQDQIIGRTSHYV